jgi:DNA polymerase-3 subunit delta
MIIIFYGINEFLIDKEIEKLKNKVDKFSYEKYDLENTLISDIVINANEANLFFNERLILVDNAYIFTGTTNKKLLEQNLDSLEAYFKNPNPNTILVFKIIKDKLDERKKIVKLAKEKGYLKEYNKIENIDKLVLNLFGDYKISKEDLHFFIERTGNNLEIIESEVSKIKLYKDNDKVITHSDILSLTSKNIDTDIFNLIDAIINKDKSKAIESYNEMIKLGEEPIMILVMLANQFRMIYQVKRLYQMGYSEKDISSELKVHWYPVKKAILKMNNYQYDILLDYLKKLAELDIAIKKGEIDKNLALEMFIIEL